MPTTYAENRLTLVAEIGGWRHHLDGQPIHAGDVLEYFDPTGRAWVSARFELIPGERGRKAVLDLPNDRTVPVGSTTRLRWALIG
jgi:hypothetical protein